MFHKLHPPSHRFTIHTDASGSWGCGAFMNRQWLPREWPREWAPQGIMAKQLVLIVLSCIACCLQLFQQSVLILCDNLSLVNKIKKGLSKDLVVMQLLHCLWFFTLYFDITLTANHNLELVTQLLTNYQETACQVFLNQARSPQAGARLVS